MLNWLGKTIFGDNQFDAYEVVDTIGRGSFGIVYKVRNQTSGMTFALKTFHDQFVPQVHERASFALFNEGHLATNIIHPNVVRILYFHDGTRYANLPPYILMEYVDGITLHQQIGERFPQKFFTSDEMEEIFRQLASGMNAINQRLVHRDVKPDNILTANGTYKITDFGLSKLVDAITRSETLKGTGAVAYYAPEAWRHEKNTTAMDMYSMGIVFYQVATLHFPYQNPLNGNWQEVHFYQQAPDPRTFNSSLDIGTVQMITKMISKSPSARYQSWDEIIARLRDKQKTSSSLRPDLTRLFQRDTEAHRQREKEELATAQRIKEQEENYRLIEYSFNEMVDIVKNFVARFNEQSEFSKLDIVQNESLTLSIVKRGSKSAKAINFVVKLAELPPQFEALMRFNTMKTKAWGIISSPSGYGFNVVLVTTRPDDLYGEWKILYKSMSYHDNNMHNPRMTPHALEELASKAGNMGLGRETFEEKLLIPLIDDLLSS